MALIPSKGGSDFPIVPTGLHKARLIRVIDEGTQEVVYQEEIQHKHKIFMLWELPECLIEEEGEFKDKPFTVALFPTLSLHKKSNLRPLLVSWRGRDFTQEEEDTFNVLDLLDETFLINVIHNESGGQIYANIGALLPLAKKDCPARVNDLVAFDLSEFDQKVFDGLSEKMQNKIKQSSEWEFRFQGGGEIAQAESRATKQSTENELPVFEELPELEIDIAEIGKEGAAELDRSMIDFDKEFKALPKKTWTALCELAERKLGEADYNSFFKDNEYSHPGFIKNPDDQAKIGKELIVVCKARE